MSKLNNLFHHSDIRRVLILGHTGFIGGHLTTYFRNQSPEIELIGLSTPLLDLTDEKQVIGLADLFDLNTAVIMCSGIKKQLGDNLEIFSQNINMVINVCNILKDRPVRRFVYFSSAEVYGDDTHNTNITEDTPVNPSSYYGIAKYTSGRLLQKVISLKEGSSLLILCPPLVYGPGDKSRGYGPSGFVWASIKRENITLWGDGSELREFIFIDDLVRLVHHLTFHNYYGIVNVASGRSYTFKNILEIISEIVSHDLLINSRSRTKMKVDHKFSNKLLLELLPDFFFTSLEDGIKQTFYTEYKEATGNEFKTVK